jgi:hypothetical protein
MLRSIWNIIKFAVMSCYVWFFSFVILMALTELETHLWWHWAIFAILPFIYAPIKNVVATKEISSASPQMIWEQGDHIVSAKASGSGHFWATLIIVCAWFLCIVLSTGNVDKTKQNNEIVNVESEIKPVKN